MCCPACCRILPPCQAPWRRSTRALDASTWTSLTAEGARVDRRRGDDDDPLAGVARIVLADETNVDVVIGRWEWELVGRAEHMTVLGVTIPVPSTAI